MKKLIIWMLCNFEKFLKQRGVIYASGKMVSNVTSKFISAKVTKHLLTIRVHSTVAHFFPFDNKKCSNQTYQQLCESYTLITT